MKNKIILKNWVFSLTLTPRQTLDWILGVNYGIKDNKPGVKAIQNINKDAALLRADWVDSINILRRIRQWMILSKQMKN